MVTLPWRHWFQKFHMVVVVIAVEYVPCQISCCCCLLYEKITMRMWMDTYVAEYLPWIEWWRLWTLFVWRRHSTVAALSLSALLCRLICGISLHLSALIMIVMHFHTASILSHVHRCQRHFCFFCKRLEWEKERLRTKRQLKEILCFKRRFENTWFCENRTKIFSLKM